jgi:hypothetical protein
MTAAERPAGFNLHIAAGALAFQNVLIGWKNSYEDQWR